MFLHFLQNVIQIHHSYGVSDGIPDLNSQGWRYPQVAKYLSNSFIFIWANVWYFHRPPIGKYEITYVIRKNYMLKIWIATWFVRLLLYMRIHINKFSRAKYFPSRMMNELNKKYVQFNQIDQWKLFLTAPWSIKNVWTVILICWIMKINRLSCWYNAQVRKFKLIDSLV